MSSIRMLNQLWSRVYVGEGSGDNTEGFVTGHDLAVDKAEILTYAGLSEGRSISIPDRARPNTRRRTGSTAG